MNKRVNGAWIIHHASKIEEHGITGKLDSLRKAGNCGQLLSALSATRQVQLDMPKVKALAEMAGIELTYQLPVLLDILQKRALVDRKNDTIEVLGLTTPSVLEHTFAIFGCLSPAPIEVATIELAERCSEAPRTDSELRQHASDRFKLTTTQTSALMQAVDAAHLCDSEDLDKTTRVYFNGALFKANSVKKIKIVLDSLTTSDRDRIDQLDGQLKAEGCAEKTKCLQLLGPDLFSKLHSIGMYEVSTVSNTSESAEYVLRPSAFHKYGRADIVDAFDLAKAFVASLQYGMNRSVSGRGRIVLLSQLMQKLVSGQTVGPCTAIGEDYRVLELKGVVQVIPAQYGMFSMRLLKKDVGQLALTVLESGDASEQSLTSLPGSPLSAYRGPEQNRTKARHATRQKHIDVRAALDALRTHGA